MNGGFVYVIIISCMSGFQSVKLVCNNLIYSVYYSIKEQMWKLRVRFFKNIQDWIVKSERIRKGILCFFTKQINPRSHGSWYDLISMSSKL